MAKQGHLLSKTLVIGIIFLFIVMSIIPSVAVDTVNIEHENGKSSNDDIDWWPMFRHDLYHSGYSTSDAPDTNNLLWKHSLGDRTFSSPAVVDGRVYIGSGSQTYGGVHCLDANTGDYIWSHRELDNVECSPAVVDGRVYIKIEVTMYCLDAISGDEIWRYIIDGGDYSSPAVVDDKVYIGLKHEKVYCLDADTGAKIWSYKTNGDVYSSPAVADGKVYIGSDDDNVYCLDADTGAKIWSYKTGSAVVSSPAVADGKVYIGSLWDEKVHCLNADSGAKIWSYKTGEKVSSSPAVADGKVYIGSDDRYVYCLDADTGAKIWSYKIGHWADSSPAIADGKVYIGGDGNVYAFGELEPDTPSIPEINGPKRGMPDVQYNFTFKSESPLGDDLFYWIEWADGSNSGWLGPYGSGVNITESHVWDSRGDYPIQAKAKDINGSVSGWGVLQLNIPRTKSTTYSLFQLLLDRFPFLEVFLRAMNLLR
jgi:outer membrane protein assembly factor BamB